MKYYTAVRNSWRKCICVLVMVGLIPSVSYAEMSDGSHELTLSTSFFHQNDSDSGSLTGDGAYGYFLSDTWEIGFRQAISATFIEDASDVWIATTTPFLRYNFNHSREQRVIPYLGIFGGLVWNDRDETGTLGPEAGVRIFGGRNVFFLGAYRYEWFFEDLKLARGELGNDFDRVSDNSSDGNHVVTIGIGYTW